MCKCCFASFESTFLALWNKADSQHQRKANVHARYKLRTNKSCSIQLWLYMTDIPLCIYLVKVWRPICTKYGVLFWYSQWWQLMMTMTLIWAFKIICQWSLQTSHKAAQMIDFSIFKPVAPEGDTVCSQFPIFLLNTTNIQKHTPVSPFLSSKPWLSPCSLKNQSAPHAIIKLEGKLCTNVIELFWFW